MSQSKNTTTSKCDFEECGRIIWKGDDRGRCIFHSEKAFEKTEDFEREWTKFLEKHKTGESTYRYINCTGFVFPAALTFSKSDFRGGADFRGTRFEGHARFEGVRFRENTYFGTARFRGGAYFEGAHFEKTISFDGARFDGNVFFEDVRFGAKADFLRSHFMESAHFWGTRFEGDALFRESHCSAGAQFVGTSFRRKLDFKQVTGGPISLEKADFTGADLRNCSLTNLHLTHITRHRGVKFGPTDIFNVNWTGSYLLREKALDQNYLHDFRYKNRFNRFFLYPLWSITSNCGRSLLIWAGWSLLMALSFGALYASKGTAWFHEAASWDAISPYYYSVVTFTTLGFGDIKPCLDCRAAQVAVTVEVVFGYIMLGGLIAILANKMARRAT
jgi:uncharacterized protein YjbI with pentapeptide repeats